MITAIEACAADRSIPPIETPRIERDWLAAQDAKWGEHGWFVNVGGLSKRKAKVASLILRALGVGRFEVLDPQHHFALFFDFVTVVRLRAALTESEPQLVFDYQSGKATEITPTQARAEMRDLLDIDDFLEHGRQPTPDNFE